MTSSCGNTFLAKFKSNHGEKCITHVTDKTELKDWLRWMATVGFLIHHARNIRGTSHPVACTTKSLQVSLESALFLTYLSHNKLSPGIQNRKNLGASLHPYSPERYSILISQRDRLREV
jgi:hypothetical protein